MSHREGNIGNASGSSSAKQQDGYPELSDPERYSSEQFDESEDEGQDTTKEKRGETDEDNIGVKREEKKNGDDFTKRLYVF